MPHGPHVWRSLDEWAQTPQFEEFLHREFPAAASMWTDEVSRRRFLALMGGSIALAGLNGCYNKPEEWIVPYVAAPENMVQGGTLTYASAMPIGGYGYGMLVQQTMGRPIKVEGNPRHPSTLGGTNVFMQAAPLGLCDPDRSKAPVFQGNDATWGRFENWLSETITRAGGPQKVRIRLLSETVTSPTLAGQIERLAKIYPNLVWHQHEPFHDDNALAGARMTFGRPISALYDLRKVRRVLSLDSNFLGEGPAHLKLAMQFADGRRVRWTPAEMEGHHESARAGGVRTLQSAPTADEVLRLYVAESSYTITGAKADHRLPVQASEGEGIARAIAAELTGASSSSHQNWVRAAAQDLKANAGRSLVIAGARQPSIVHALAHGMNAILGSPVGFVEPVEANPIDHMQSLRELVAAMNEKQVDLLMILSANPVFDAPVDFAFAQAMANVPNRVRLGPYLDETSFHCHWHLPESHFLESWGDVRGHDGTASIIQPLIAPLYASRSAVELMQMLSQATSMSGYEGVREHWFRGWRNANIDAESAWIQSLRMGVIEGTARSPITVAPAATLQSLLAQPATQPATAPSGLELNFLPDPTVWDGRFANLGWLQECPKPITKITWDNPALMSPRTAVAMGLAPADTPQDANGQMIRVSIGERSLEMAAWVVPGHSDNVISLYCGYGRERIGRVGNRTGFNVYALRTSGALHFASGAKIDRISGRYQIACTQNHQLMHGREIVRMAEVGNLAGLVKQEAHGAQPPLDAVELESRKPAETGQRVHLSLYPEFPYRGYRWGMVIDQTACIGCNACVVACQSENNIPVVGKSEVLRSREMHWLRIDTYFTAESEKEDWKHQAQIPSNPRVLFQPMLCQHCEKAPCEIVCPVAATSHSEEGLNEMTYNRCVGTRYCSNNCPYKVRRFNFFEYASGESSLQIMRNPEVSVRTRGVMEKCTYCVQRINKARTEGKIAQVNDPKVVMRTPAGDAEALPALAQLTACQQACPTEAIIFGDINDADSFAHRIKFGQAFQPIHYGVLTELNTQPRTTYLAVLTNPNPALAVAKAHASRDTGILPVRESIGTGKMPVSREAEFA